MKNGKLKRIILITVSVLLVIGIAVAVGFFIKNKDKGGTDKPSDSETESSVLKDPDEHCFHVYDDGVIHKEPTCTEMGKMLYTCSSCGGTKTEDIPVIEHTYGEGVVTKEPTLNEEGEMSYTCTVCEYVKTEPIEMLPATYVITMDGIGELRLGEDGTYELADPEKPGYKFIKWVTSDGKTFASKGTITADITVSAVFELLMTTTVEQLEERAAQGADTIHITKDIVIDRPIYVTSGTKIYSDKNVTLKRDPKYAGDMFVVGEDKNGIPSVIVQKNAELTLGGGKGTVTIDGNRDKLSVIVSGSALYVSNSATVNIYDGIVIKNNKKLANDRSLTCESFAGEYAITRPGGAALLIMNGTVNMYGGVIENNLVVTEGTVVNNEDGSQSTLETAGCGGAVYNCGDFNMYGGIIRNNEALRGGAIYNDEMVNLVSGTISNNLSHTYGGAISSSSSQEAHTYMGTDTKGGAPMEFIGNRAVRAGGVFYSSTNSPIVIFGNTLFKNNVSESSGGAIYTAGGLTVRGATFEGNTGRYSGGAIYFHYAHEDRSPRIMELTDCTFTGNKANLGGAVTVSASDAVADKKYAAKAVITNCKFDKNEAVLLEKDDGTLGAGNGGAVYITRKTTATITGCSFTNNIADNNAGALAIHSNANVTLKDSSFKNNTATYGGAIYTSSDATLDVNGVELEGNKAEKIMPDGAIGHGGALYANGVTFTSFKNVTFTNNSAAVNAGAAYINALDLILDSTVSFVNNSAGGHGGALYLTYRNNEDKTRTPSTLTANGTKFENNTALAGGAISARTDSVLKISNVAFKGNTTPDAAQGTSNGGGVIYSNNSTIELKKVTMDGSSSGYYGGAMKLDTCAVTVKDLTVSGTQGGTGGAIYASGGSLTAENLTLSNNTATNNGVIYLTKTTASIKNLTANGNSANCGGAIHAGVGTKLEIDGASLTGNTAAHGGAIYVTAGELVLKNASVTGNSADRNGGAIYSSGSVLNISGSNTDISNNTAAEHGGALYLSYVTADNGEKNGSKVVIDGGKLNGNTALAGGAISARTAVELKLTGTVLSNNKATGKETNEGGGAIYANNNTLVLSGVTLDGNASAYYGGAIASDTASVTIKDNSIIKNNKGVTGVALEFRGGEHTLNKITVIDNNKTAVGDEALGSGVIYATGNAKLNISELTASGNKANNGGVIYASGESQITIENSKLTGNVANGNGGAIDNRSTAPMTVKRTELSGNSAKNGGAIYLYSNANLTADTCIFKGNNASVSGGAVSVYGSGFDVIGETLFEENKATDKGGAIWVNEYVPTAVGEETPSAVKSSLNVNGATFSKNEANTGGAIYVAKNAYTVSNSKFLENVATDKNYGGGAIYNTGATSTLSGVVFDGNHSHKGGAVALHTKSEMTVDSMTAKGNYAEANADGKEGNGGVFYVNSSILKLNEGDGKSIVLGGDGDEGNRAISGGAIYAVTGGNAPYVEISGAQLKGNVSTDANENSNTSIGGGAIYVSGGELKLSGVSLENNTTGYYGGAILAIGATVTVNGNSTVSGNNGGTGAALYFREECNVTIENSSITDNVSTANGVVYVNHSSLTLNKVTASGNKAANGGVIYASGTAEVSVTDSEFAENAASANHGGAIFADGATVNVCGGRFYKNSAAKDGGAIYAKLSTVSIEGATFEENSASNHGGAVDIVGSVATAAGENKFLNNSAAKHGGAVYVVYLDVENQDKTTTRYYGKLTMTDGLFEGNTALGGGAVSIRSGCDASFNGTTFDGNSVEGFADNHDGDGEGGGAIYVGFGKLTLENVTMTGNTAESGFGGAVNLIGSSTVANIKNTTVKSGNNGIYVHSGKLNVGGKVTVDGNTDSNVRLNSGTFITVTEALDADANIGITADMGTVVKGSAGITVDGYAANFHSDTDAPLFAKDGELLLGFVILEEPSAINGYTVLTSTEAESYQWHKWVDGAIGEAVNGQTGSALTSGNIGETYACVATYKGVTVTTVPVTYYERTSHTVCGDPCNCGSDKNHDSIEWTPVTNLEELKQAVLKGGSYYLTFDAELEETLVINSDVQLDLNGHKISPVEGGSFALIEVNANGSLTLCDSGSDERLGYIDPATKLWVEGVYTGSEAVISYPLYGGVITGAKGGAIRAYGKLELYNVSLAGNASESIGGAIYASSDVYAYNTSFVGNKAASSHGGAIYLVGSKMTANGDNRFMYNTAGGHAGAIYLTYVKEGSVPAVLEMTDGLFEGNTAIGGGAVSIRSYCEATFNGTVFRNNSITVGTTENNDGDAEGGGAIYIGYAKKLTLKNVTMIGNTAFDSFGGAVNACQSEVQVSGGRFENNSALYGGAFHVLKSAVLTVDQGAVISANESTYKQIDSYNSSLGGGAILSNKSTVTLSGVTLEGNTADYYGGAILAIGGSVTVNGNSTISGNNGGTGATLYMKGGCQATVENSSVSSNTASANGVIYINSGSLIFNKVTATGNSALNGGVIYASGTAEVSVTDSEFAENSASYGGAIFADGATVNVYGGRFYKNSAAKDGGAIYAKLSTVSIEGVTFEENSASNHGGAVDIVGSVATAAGENKFLNNSAAKHGGAVYVVYLDVENQDKTTTRYYGKLTMTDGLFEGNTALGGGAVSIRTGCEASFNGTAFNGNSVTGYADKNDGDGEGGGAIYVGYGMLTLENVTMTENKATDGFGGAIDAVSATVTVTGGTFTGNTAAISGGAIHAIIKSNITVSGAAFSGNESKYTTNVDSKIGGGAIYIKGGKLTVSGSTFSGNKTGYYGGAIYAGGATVVLNENCTVSGSIGQTGSALYFRDGCDATITDSYVTDNSNNNGNGVIYASGGSLTVENLVATGNKAYNGGVFYISGSATATLINVKASGNEARDGGGVIFVSGTGTNVTVEDCSIGGAITVGETAVRGNNAKLGGAIFVENGTVNVNGTTLTENSASENGGAIYVKNGTVNVSGNSVISNNSAYHGAAIGLINKATVNVEASTISNNVSTSDGGAIWMQGGVLNLNAGTLIEGNTAASGGAVCMDKYTETPEGATEATVVEPDVNVNGAEFRNNIAQSNGGAIFVISGSLELVNVKMIGNKAESSHGGAIYTKSGDTVTVSGSKTLFEGNSAKQHGGAIYLTYSGSIYSKLEMTDGAFKNNSALGGGAVSIRTGCEASFNGTAFNGNSVTGYADKNDGDGEGGGAIYVGYGTLTLENVTMTENKATDGFGGAIDAVSATVTVTGGTFTGNTAAISGGAIHAFKKSNITVSGATFSGNVSQYTAVDNKIGGGAIYINGGKLTVSGTSFSGNKSGYYGGAIYAGGATVVLNENCTVSGSIGQTGSALYFRDGGTATITDSNITNNSNNKGSGVVYLTGTGTLTMENVVATGNKSDKGGVLYVSGGTVVVNNSTFSGNTAVSEGGAIRISVNNALTINNCVITGNTAATGGGIYATNGVNYTKTGENNISGNTATTGADEYKAS